MTQGVNLERQSRQRTAKQKGGMEKKKYTHATRMNKHAPHMCVHCCTLFRFTTNLVYASRKPNFFFSELSCGFVRYIEMFRRYPYICTHIRIHF